MARWMLDTNTVSYFIRQTLTNAPEQSDLFGEICISAITEAELVYGLRRRPAAMRFNEHVSDFIAGITIVPFGREAAEAYGGLRAEMQSMGKSLPSLTC